MSAHSLTDANGDRGMVKVMGMVLFSLFLLSLFLFSVARLLGVGSGEDESDSLMRNALISRIEPVGQVRTSADDLPHGDGIEVAAAGGGERSGEELVNGVCAGCHQSGAGGAPLLGDEEAWAERREEGLDYLVSSVIDGKGSMPARGGSDYSDEEIRRAVQHIALFEEEEAPAAEGEASEDSAAAEQTDQADSESAESEGTESAEASTEESGEAAGEESAEASAEESGEATGKESAESAEAAGEGSGGGDSVDLVAMIGSGEAPEGMADSVKGAVDGVCAGCHIAGAAGAPKLGDVEAWTPRAEMGLAALTESVVNGKGAMPARGGSQLTDEEIPVAIKYLITKQP